MQIIRKGQEEDIIKCSGEGDLLYLTFPLLTDTDRVEHLFTTRWGGVSEGMFSSLNLSYTRGDQKDAVDENFRRIAALLQRDIKDFVLSDQTHTANVRVVTKEDAGKGIAKERDYQNVDGMVTNVPGIVLCTFYADCVPLYFVDPVHNAIGLSHSGWKGTVNKIGEETVNTMVQNYGSRPEEIIAAIGPSICQECYEVDEDVIEEFERAFPDSNVQKEIFYRKANGRYQLDLWEANRFILLQSGVKADHIAVTDICTCCNPDFLFSHRASKGKRGNLAAFLSIRKS